MLSSTAYAFSMLANHVSLAIPNSVLLALLLLPLLPRPSLLFPSTVTFPAIIFFFFFKGSGPPRVLPSSPPRPSPNLPGALAPPPAPPMPQRFSGRGGGRPAVRAAGRYCRRPASHRSQAS